MLFAGVARARNHAEAANHLCSASWTYRNLRHGTECNLALSSMRRTDGTTTGIYGSSPSSAVPCPRFFVTLQHIADHSMCSRHTCALVCLHAASIRQIGIRTAPIEPSLQRKLVGFSSASSLSAKTQSNFDHAINAVSP